MEREITPEDIFNDEKREVIKQFILNQKPTLERYLICIGRSLNNYSYDPLLVLENTDYFIECYNKNINVVDALDKFSEI